MSAGGGGGRPLTLRARLMLIGLGGVAAALLVGGSAFYAALTFAVDRTLDNEALAGAHEVAALVDAGKLPNPVPVSGAQVVQVVDAEHRVVGGSVTADRLTPLLRRDELATALGGAAVVVPGSRAALSTPLRVRAVTAGPADARVSVLVALPVGDVLASRAALRRGLLIVFPLVLAAMAAVAWRVIGSTLRPVEQLRADAERISGTSRAERLAVPAASDEIRALAVTLNSMLDRLAAARARQRSFVADAAHELRSPLTSIRTQLEVAQRLGEGGSLPAELLLDVERLTRLVADLLLLARADADTRGPARVERFEVADLLAEVAAGQTGARVPLTVRSEGCRRSWATGTSCGGRCRTWSTTPSGTRRRRSSWRCCPGTISGWSSATTGPGSVRRSGSASSSASPGWTTPAVAARAAPDSGCRSRVSWWPGQAAPSPSPTPRRRGPCRRS